MASLPYVTAPGNIEKALSGIRSAATPDRVTQDFVKTILKIPGGSGDQITSFLKKLGFSNPDGSPSDIYKKFRNSSTSGQAMAKAIKTAYAPLYIRNEYMHELADNKLKGLIIEETGQSEGSNVVALIMTCIKTTKKFANFGAGEVESDAERSVSPDREQSVALEQIAQQSTQKLGLNLSYTINLNLPATSDVAVFNAIFKSLKENLLKSES